jgi:hypothetical protein
VAGSTIHTPISVASATLMRPAFNGNNSASTDVATLAVCPSYTNLSGFGYTAPRTGFILATTSGIYAPGAVNAYVRVCIGDTEGTDPCDGWAPILESSTTTGYMGEKMFSLQRWYSVAASATKTAYLKACRETDTTTGNLMWNDFIMNFNVIE